MLSFPVPPREYRRRMRGLDPLMITVGYAEEIGLITKGESHQIWVLAELFYPGRYEASRGPA